MEGIDNIGKAEETNLLAFNDQSRMYLNETAKWAKFLSIVGMIGIVLLVVFGIIMSFTLGSMMANLGGDSSMLDANSLGYMYMFIYIIIALIYVYPILKLYQFSIKAKEALSTNNDTTLATSLGEMKSMFKYMGIFTIIMLSIYALVLIAAFLTIGFSSFF